MTQERFPKTYKANFPNRLGLTNPPMGEASSSPGRWLWEKTLQKQRKTQWVLLRMFFYKGENLAGNFSWSAENSQFSTL